MVAGFPTGLDDVFVLAAGDVEEVAFGAVGDEVRGRIALKKLAECEKAMRNALVSRAAVVQA